MKLRWNPVAALLIWLVRLYQILISPLLPRSCKYYPSCSQYAVDALTQYGVLRGVVLAGWRLLRCNPWSYGGYDPVDRQTLFGRARSSACAIFSSASSEGTGCSSSVRFSASQRSS